MEPAQTMDRPVLQDLSIDANAAADAAPALKAPLLQRSRSDVMSGLNAPTYSLNSSYSEKELQAHYERFKAYDLDESGFISADNLGAILTALEIPHTAEQVVNMIAEVAILSGHDNDGQLSFRDYIRCMEYEAQREAVNESIEAAHEERMSARLSRTEEPAEVEAVEPAAEEAAVEPAAEAEAEAEAEASVTEQRRMRRSSFATLDMITRTRINRFQQAVDEAAKVNKVSDEAARRQMRFQSKLAKFEAPIGTPRGNEQETMYKKSVKDKLNAFEVAHSAAVDQVAFKKTWKKVGAGNWKQKSQVAGAPPPKRNIADLP